MSGPACLCIFFSLSLCPFTINLASLYNLRLRLTTTQTINAMQKHYTLSSLRQPSPFPNHPIIHRVSWSAITNESAAPEPSCSEMFCNSSFIVWLVLDLFWFNTKHKQGNQTLVYGTSNFSTVTVDVIVKILLFMIILISMYQCYYEYRNRYCKGA